MNTKIRLCRHAQITLALTVSHFCLITQAIRDTLFLSTPLLCRKSVQYENVKVHEYCMEAPLCLLAVVSRMVAILHYMENQSVKPRLFCSEHQVNSNGICISMGSAERVLLQYLGSGKIIRESLYGYKMYCIFRLSHIGQPYSEDISS